MSISTKVELRQSVSRETWEKLEAFRDALVRWQKALNLVSKSTLPDIWQRHIMDSVQLLSHASAPDGLWADLGSGGGFPGAVCAIVAQETQPNRAFVLIESDARKCAFLRDVSRITDTAFTVINKRIESVAPLEATVLSARALAPLPKLLALAAPHLGPDGECLFLKGANYKAELEDARLNWHMKVDIIPSATSPQSVILRIGELSDAQPQ